MNSQPRILRCNEEIINEEQELLKNSFCEAEPHELEGNSSEQSELECLKETRMDKVIQQNKELKQKVFELELQQRNLMSRIIQLEMNLVKSQIDRSQYQKGFKNISILHQLNGTQNRKISNGKQNGEVPNTKKSIDSKASKQERDEKKFIEAMKGNYKQMFGIQNLKDIWKKHKQIIAEWVLYEP